MTWNSASRLVLTNKSPLAIHYDSKVKKKLSKYSYTLVNQYLCALQNAVELRLKIARYDIIVNIIE